ncbi:ABC transporter permease [Microbacterium mangrovi]|uniref:ABC transporter permease n=1 Tax=Microbacterium mangrovi TaxID=1348253 RepID=A0A0B2A4T3_9MICO|nr:ABC transporter permease [Microbacterium mangrovi]KHK98514.1 ABC transporter permease [Microbacterium mangrovi]
MSWVLENLGLIWQLSLEHVRQSIPPIVLGLVISIPLGWLAWRYRLVREPVLVITGILYTIPSLALLMILPVVLGISPLSELNLVVALTLYAIALMTRSVADGLESVDPDVRLAATAMGYGASRRFFTVELRLAGPVILAGLRVTAVSTVALATVGILIGVQNLGYLFTNGLQRQIVAEVLSGVVAVMIIALIFDALLVGAGRLAMPWQSADKTPRGSRRTRIMLEAGS